jgi:hypothetical protein
VPVGTNLFANLLPLNLNATNIYLGKSQWPADPYFSGRLSSVRIFSRALAANEITSPQITISQPGQGATYHPGDTITFAGAANDFYDNPISVTGLTWSASFINAGSTNIVFGPTSGNTTGSFSIPASGSGATNGYYQIQLSAVDTSGQANTNSVTVYPLPLSAVSSWASYYPFTNGAQDVSYVYNATLRNGASIVSDPVRGKVLGLQPLGAQYVNLPSGAAAAQTVSGWVYWNGGNSWQRVFDFGQNNNQFFFLTPSDSSNLIQCAITPNLAVYNQVIESPAPMPTNQWTHLAVVMDSRQGILYINGNAVAVNNSVNLLPSDVVGINCNFGKSQFSADPFFNGRLSAMKLNSSPLPLSQIVAPVPTITQPVNGTLFAGGQPLNFAGTATDYSGITPLGSNSFSWSGEFHSNGVGYAAFGPISAVTNGTYLVPTNATTITNVYYRVLLTVTDTNGNQQTALQDVQPQTSQLTLATVPAGLQLSLDEQPLTTTTSIVAVVGMSRLMAAPSPQNYGGNNYQFVVWSDGGAATHSFLVPATNSVFTASYLQPNLAISSSGSNLLISWPDWAGAMKLYQAPSLTPPISWYLLTSAPVLSNGWFNLALPATNDAQFYRLQLQ